MSKEVIRIEDEEFNKKLLQTTTVEEYMNCYEQYLSEPIGNRNIGFANDEVAKYFCKLLKEDRQKEGLSDMIILPDGTKMPLCIARFSKTETNN